MPTEDQGHPSVPIPTTRPVPTRRAHMLHSLISAFVAAIALSADPNVATEMTTGEVASWVPILASGTCQRCHRFVTTRVIQPASESTIARRFAQVRSVL